jgi:hypothetical protein
MQFLATQGHRKNKLLPKLETRQEYTENFQAAPRKGFATPVADNAVVDFSLSSPSSLGEFL